ncbi:PspA/IM30 family protein [Rhizobiales bacterium RZME27]|uniref:PspA/IM30 family protein n=1 Tax=Endobacterium cereale TaxID=2663029 RepID=A0A6A8AD88_9HYPH|nr:PspA/IM30 family protein [Endobacterium cereale]MEB2847963.1 PspA/IM30 family protein [Endobacterium cereale]MQY46701.1 PspA/IM30 family protein [Endobacterium cereale]
MSTWSKIFTAIRGGVNEAAESVADNQAMRILDQEIRDAEQSLRQARSDLAGIMASNKSVARRLEENRAKETKDSDSARSAVSAGRMDLAQGLAQRIATIRSEVQRDQEELDRLLPRQQQMLRTIQDTEARITQMKREVENVKANESLLKAQSAIAHSQSGINTRLGSAVESLERIKKRQEMTAGRIEAGAELAALENGNDLDRQLREAGIGGSSQSADDILKQLMAPGGSGEQLLLPAPSAKAY